MKDFSALLDRLAYTPSRNDKLRLMADYFAGAPDPDRAREQLERDILDAAERKRAKEAAAEAQRRAERYYRT